MGAPLGNKNAAKPRIINRMFRDYALDNPDKVRDLIDMLYAEANGGNVQAAALIFDRTEGKAAQPVTGGDEDDQPLKLLAMVELVRPEP